MFSNTLYSTNFKLINQDGGGRVNGRPRFSFRQPRGRYGRSFGSMKPTANCASETSRGTGRE